MGKGEFVTITSKSHFRDCIANYCCVFEVEFFGIESRVEFENYISSSRCDILENAFKLNGRVVKADRLFTTITDVDWGIITKMYRWKKVRIHRFIRYRKGYLPTDFIRAILKLYADKTTLKGVTGKETEYLFAKELLNSCYGMCVTSAVMDSHPYTDHWLSKEEQPEVDVAEELRKYNTNRNRFLFFPWGIFCTAYARRNLFLGILECGEDYCYSDTDSIKIKNAEQHMVFINHYNEMIIKRLETAMDYHGLPHDMIRPKTVKGIEKPLGVWDFDGNYSRFKPLRAKSYMVEYSDDPRNAEKSGTISITVSGINKYYAIPQLFRGLSCSVTDHGLNYDPFVMFDDGMSVEPEYTGKMTHTYIDNERTGTVVDYMGVESEYLELSGIHLEKTGYDLNLDGDFVGFVLSLH